MIHNGNFSSTTLLHLPETLTSFSRFWVFFSQLSQSPILQQVLFLASTSQPGSAQTLLALFLLLEEKKMYCGAFPQLSGFLQSIHTLTVIIQLFRSLLNLKACMSFFPCWVIPIKIKNLWWEPCTNKQWGATLTRNTRMVPTNWIRP